MKITVLKSESGMDNIWKQFKKKIRRKLHERSAEKSKVTVMLCPIVSRAGTDIEAALQKIPENKPAVLLAFHQTLETEPVLPNSRRCEARSDVLIVHGAFNEDKGLLECRTNTEASTEVTNFLNSVKKSSRRRGEHLGPNQGLRIGPRQGRKYFAIVVGNTLKSHEQILKILHDQRVLRKKTTVEKCQVILVFCPVTSRAGTDIDTALKELNHLSDSKPAVLVVLHHTFDPDSTTSDSKRSVERAKTHTVDCLFHEDKGLLKCSKNDSALQSIAEWVKTVKALQAINTGSKRRTMLRSAKKKD